MRCWKFKDWIFFYNCSFTFLKKNVFLNNLVMVQYVFIHKCKILKKYKFYNFTFSYYVEIKRMLLETQWIVVLLSFECVCVMRVNNSFIIWNLKNESMTPWHRQYLFWITPPPQKKTHPYPLLGLMIAYCHSEAYIPDYC